MGDAKTGAVKIHTPIELKAWMHDGTEHVVRYYREADYDALAERLAEVTEFGIECQRAMYEARARLAEEQAQHCDTLRHNAEIGTALTEARARLAEAERLLRSALEHELDPYYSEHFIPNVERFLIAADSASVDATHQLPQEINARPADAPADAFICSGCDTWANWSGDSFGWALCNCGKFRRPTSTVTGDST